MSDEIVIVPNKDRLPNGRFAPNNSLATSTGLAGYYVKNRHILLKAANDDDLIKLYKRVLDIALHSENEKVALEACEQLRVWLCGKDKAEVSFEVTQVAPPNREMALIELRQVINAMGDRGTFNAIAIDNQ